MAQRRLNDVTLEDVQIRFRNFTGKEGTYNRAGDRNFAIFLDPDTATAMEEDGWNVKQLKPREEGDVPQDYIKAKVSYNPKARPPKIVLVTSRGKTTLDEDTVDMLDWADIVSSDVILNPFAYDVNGKTGYSAYVKTLFCTIREDDLERKYADMEDTGQNPATRLINEDEDNV